MSQQESFEANITKHDWACETLHEKFTEQFNAESDKAFNQTLKAISNVLKIEHTILSSKTESALEDLRRTSQETRTGFYDIARQALQDKGPETAALREEYEAKLKAKDEEIKALRESVHDPSMTDRDKDDMIATLKELNQALRDQLQERMELYELKEEEDHRMAVKDRREVEEIVRNKEAEFRKGLLEAHKKTQAQAREIAQLSQKVQEDAVMIKHLSEGIEELSADRVMLENELKGKISEIAELKQQRGV
ncbi:uncharacterized protein FSUBG_13496 [Fusarium subglutinans]|uniref:Uncharacterized protein n=1 Tax=Gibberella subglutinans TaxID=42677 RepID=A0A8H5NVB6_GIBSU|nr:uncharacterized protein FSUBG_13496 [Fusarium subglutinans]KAF5580057.1 hypothetical protein FSUBG_13496 [Fusarium subglutinans]